MENAVKSNYIYFVKFLMENYNIKLNVNCFESIIESSIKILLLHVLEFNYGFTKRKLETNEKLMNKLYIVIDNDNKENVSNVSKFLNEHKMEPDILFLRHICVENKFKLVEFIIKNYNIDIDSMCTEILIMNKKYDLVLLALKKLFDRKTK
jgi:hypothetical protein